MKDTNLDDVVADVKKSSPSKYGKLGGSNDSDEDCMFGLSMAVLGKFEFKKLLLLFIILIIIHSSIYLNRVLEPLEGATIGNAITSKGTMIQISTIVGAFGMINFLVNCKYL